MRWSQREGSGDRSSCVLGRVGSADSVCLCCRCSPQTKRGASALQARMPDGPKGRSHWGAVGRAPWQGSYFLLLRQDGVDGATRCCPTPFSLSGCEEPAHKHASLALAQTSRCVSGESVVPDCFGQRVPESDIAALSALYPFAACPPTSARSLCSSLTA